MSNIAELEDMAAQLTALAAQVPPSHPDYAACRAAESEAYSVLAEAQWGRGDLEAARNCLDRSLMLHPRRGGAIRRAVMMHRIQQSRQSILQTRDELRAALEALVAAPQLAPNLAAGATGTLFTLAYHGELGNAELHRLFHRACSAADPTLDWTAPHCRQPRRPGRPRVGFVSWFVAEKFSEHTITSLFRGLIRDFGGDAIDSVVFTFEDDGAPATWEGKRRVALPRDLLTAQQAIAAEELDVLIYLDLGMDNFTLFLAHARLARCQALLWGHPDTTGLDSMDVFLSPACMEPEDGDSHYTERLVRLPGPTVLFPKPQPPEPLPDRASLGLPATGTLYLCPQSPFKFHPDFDDVLARILTAVPDGHLILTAGWEQELMAKVKARIAARAPAVAERIHILGSLKRPDFHALFCLCDVVLDPLHYSGGHTALEAFAFGAPTVTWPGTFMRARHTAGFYQLMGIDNAIARDHDHYVELAVQLGLQVEARKTLSQKILTRNDVLYNNHEGARALECFVQEQVQEN